MTVTRLTCTKCNVKLKVPEKLAGKAVKCPKCSTPISVPKIATDAILNTPEPVPVAADPIATPATAAPFAAAPAPIAASPSPAVATPALAIPEPASTASAATASRLDFQPASLATTFVKPVQTPEAPATRLTRPDLSGDSLPQLPEVSNIDTGTVVAHFW